MLAIYSSSFIAYDRILKPLSSKDWKAGKSVDICLVGLIPECYEVFLKKALSIISVLLTIESVVAGMVF